VASDLVEQLQRAVEPGESSAAPALLASSPTAARSSAWSAPSRPKHDESTLDPLRRGGAITRPRRPAILEGGNNWQQIACLVPCWLN
jgi:hypothetical protein